MLEIVKQEGDDFTCPFCRGDCGEKPTHRPVYTSLIGKFEEKDDDIRTIMNRYTLDIHLDKENGKSSVWFGIRKKEQ